MTFSWRSPSLLLNLPIISCDKRFFVKVKDAYHYAKIFGNVGRFFGNEKYIFPTVKSALLLLFDILISSSRLDPLLGSGLSIL